MNIAASPLARLLRQFRRKALAYAGVAAVLGIVLAAFLNPTHNRLAAVLLGVSASVLASLIVAAVAFERSEFAEALLRLGIDQIFKDRLHDIPEGLWTDLLEGVREHFNVLGMANHGYLNSDVAKRDTEAALRKALGRRKVTVQFLWLDPRTDIADLREQEEGARGLRRDTCRSIEYFFGLRETLRPDQQDRISLRLYRSLPTCGITWADSRLIVTHYLAGELNLRAPGVALDTAIPLVRRGLTKLGFPARETPPLAEAYIRNYREVASDAWSRELGPEVVDEIRSFRESLGPQADKRSEADLRRNDDGSSNEDGASGGLNGQTGDSGGPENAS